MPQDGEPSSNKVWTSHHQAEHSYMHHLERTLPVTYLSREYCPCMIEDFCFSRHVWNLMVRALEHAQTSASSLKEALRHANRNRIPCARSFQQCYPLMIPFFWQWWFRSLFIGEFLVMWSRVDRHTKRCSLRTISGSMSLFFGATYKIYARFGRPALWVRHHHDAFAGVSNLYMRAQIWVRGSCCSEFSVTCYLLERPECPFVSKFDVVTLSADGTSPRDRRT